MGELEKLHTLLGRLLEDCRPEPPAAVTPEPVAESVYSYRNDNHEVTCVSSADFAACEQCISPHTCTMDSGPVGLPAFFQFLSARRRLSELLATRPLFQMLEASKGRWSSATCSEPAPPC